MNIDYSINDENEVVPRRIKMFSDPRQIIEVVSACGLRCEIVRHPAWIGFCVVKVFATRKQYKAAQYAWLQRMIDEKIEMEIEL